MTSKSTVRKIAVLNFSGNVGKSTLARHLLSPRMPAAGVVSVETINADGAGEQTIRGTDFGQMQEDLQLEAEAIVDVGASNVEQFLALMRQYRGSHEDFDLFLVPTVPDLKQQRDTVECINELARLGVPAEKIKIVFNMVEPGTDVERVFAPVLAFVAAEGKCGADLRAVILRNEVFAKLSSHALSIAQVLGDPADLKAEIAKAVDRERKVQLAEQLSVKRLASGVQENLDTVFASLVE